MADLDPDEQEQFAALERLAAERDAETHQAQRELQTPERRPVDVPLQEHQPRPPVSRLESRAAGEQMPLVPFISAEAVDQRLRALEAQLHIIDAQTRHTMLLTMILADRQRVTAEEYRTADAKTQRVEQAAKGPQ